MVLTGTALGTSWRVLYAARTGHVPIRLREAIERRLSDIVAQMSQWEPSSLLSRFNRAAAGAWFDLPDDFTRVMQAARDVATRSDGAFDPTHGRAASLLGFGALRVAGSPADGDLADALRDAGWSRLGHDSAMRRLRQPGGLWLDFAGIAKGYAVDTVADLIISAGCPDCFVEIGGELAGRGLNSNGQPWWVDVEDIAGGALSSLRIGLHDVAVATSGDYIRGAHTLDPRTGKPMERHVAQVSVIHRSAMLADAWATALTVIGPNEGIVLADQENLAVHMITRRAEGFQDWSSANLRRMIDG